MAKLEIDFGDCETCAAELEKLKESLKAFKSGTFEIHLTKGYRDNLYHLKHFENS